MKKLKKTRYLATTLVAASLTGSATLVASAQSHSQSLLNVTIDKNHNRVYVADFECETKISITSPYFVPDEATLLVILTAASSGVEVELFVSEVADQFLVYHAQRSYYSALLAAGVSIYLSTWICVLLV